MFTQNSAVSEHCIFGMNFYYVRREQGFRWGMVGAMVGDGWCNVE